MPFSTAGSEIPYVHEQELTMTASFTELTGFCWSIADLLRGDYKQSDYGTVNSPFTLLWRLECVLDSTEADVHAEHKERKAESMSLGRSKS